MVKLIWQLHVALWGGEVAVRKQESMKGSNLGVGSLGTPEGDSESKCRCRPVWLGIDVHVYTSTLATMFSVWQVSWLHG